jgi:hypothetical protein
MTKEEFNAYMRKRYASRPDVRAKQIAQTLARYRGGGRASVVSQNKALKEKVLTHYGHDGALECCWLSCTVRDIDMLTLDHIKNDGAIHRKEIGLSSIYRWVKKHGFPEGFQTLCMNHQLKKEILRKRLKMKVEES